MLLRVYVGLYLKGKGEAHRYHLRNKTKRICRVVSVSFVSGHWYSLQ